MKTEEAYSILGLDHKASEAAVKTAYKKLALKHHPGIESENLGLLFYYYNFLYLLYI